MVYKWKTERFPIEAQKAGEELERIEKVHGGIEPEIVVNEAKPEEAILHKCFCWNDDIAANKWREQQARVLIGNIVVIKVEEKEVESTRAFVNIVSDKEENEKKYISVVTAMNDDDYRGQILKQALKELASFKQKYSNLQELEKVFKVIDEESNKLKAS